MNRIWFKYLVFLENFTVYTTLTQSPLRIKKQNKLGKAASAIPIAQIRKLKFKGTDIARKQCCRI